jgi:Mg2+ and Co2+ transporter CorA
MLFQDSSDDLTSNEEYVLQEVIHGMEKVELNVFIYNESSYFEKKCSDVIDILSVIQNDSSTKCIWIEVTGPIEQRNDIVQQLGIYFNLHMLTVEDIQTVKERMKVDIFDDGIYLLMKMLYIYEHNHMKIQQQQVNFYLKDNILITFQEKHTPLFLPIKQRLANSRGRLTKLKSDYLFYCLVDIIVENYMIVLDWIGLKIENIEAKLMQMQVKSLKLDTLKLIYNIKHEMLHFRIMCSPLKDIIIKLQKAYDRLPRRDPFAVKRQGLRPLTKKRGLRTNRHMSVCISQPITSRKRSISPKQANILQTIKSRARSVSPIRTSILQPIKARARSASPTPTYVAPRRKSRQSLSSNDVTILHEYTFMYLKNLHVHILQMNSTIETYSEMISWLTKFYMALNEATVRQIARLLAMLQAMHYPIMTVHGLNSMNFDWVPQRDDYYNSYFIFLGIMALIVLIGVTTLKVKKWI